MIAAGSPPVVKRLRAPTADSIEEACFSQPVAMRAATGCSDPQTALDLIESASDGMPGSYYPKPSGTKHKTIAASFDALAPVAHELRCADADAGILALAIARSEAWANRLLDIAAVTEVPSREQERVIRLALKFQAMSLRQIEALSRIKRGCQQVVRVERVQINGGQTIIGAVGADHGARPSTAGTPGGG